MKIENPTQKTYFICRDKNFTITAYGEVEINRSMSTGQPILEKYLDRSEWINELSKSGIMLDEEFNNEITI
jgi:hypothetical protein